MQDMKIRPRRPWQAEVEKRIHLRGGTDTVVTTGHCYISYQNSDIGLSALDQLASLISKTLNNSHTEALLALSNTMFLSLIGPSCWATLYEGEHRTEKLQFLCEPEKGTLSTYSTLVCSKCCTFHKREAFNIWRQQAKPPISRACFIDHSEVVLGHQARLTRLEMQAMANNTTWKESHMLSVPSSYPWCFQTDHVHVTFETLKMNLVFCVETRWEIPSVTPAVKAGNHLDFCRRTHQIPGSSCPHHSGDSIWFQLMWLRLEQRDWVPSMLWIKVITCTRCPIEFDNAVEISNRGQGTGMFCDYYVEIVW